LAGPVLLKQAMDDLAQPPTLNATPALVALILAALSKVSNHSAYSCSFHNKEVAAFGCLGGGMSVGFYHGDRNLALVPCLQDKQFEHHI